VKKYFVLGFAFAAAIAAVALLVGARKHNVATWTFGPSTDTTPTVSIPPLPPPPPAVRRQALAVVDANFTFRSVTKGIRKRLVLVQPWAGQNEGLHGASLTFRLSKPITVDADLPQQMFGRAEVTPSRLCQRPAMTPELRSAADHARVLRDGKCSVASDCLVHGLSRCGEILAVIVGA
jgi:hypothetical protein